MGEFLSKSKYLCAYYSYKKKFRNAAKAASIPFQGSQVTTLPNFGKILIDQGRIRFYARKMTGLGRILEYFDDSNNKKPIERKKFEIQLLDSVKEKYNLQINFA